MIGNLTGSELKSMDHIVALAGSGASCGPNHLLTTLWRLHAHCHVRHDSQQVLLAQEPTTTASFLILTICRSGHVPVLKQVIGLPIFA